MTVLTGEIARPTAQGITDDKHTTLCTVLQNVKLAEETFLGKEKHPTHPSGR